MGQVGNSKKHSKICIPRTSSHEIDSFEDLESSDLSADDRSIEMARRFCVIGSNAPDKVRLGVY